MTALILTPAERKAHKADAHHLNPVVMIGGDGLTPNVLKEADTALKAHGLIKVRVFSDDRAAREALLATLCEQLHAAPVQHIGKLLVLWRPQVEEVKPAAEDRRPGPRVVTVVKPSRSANHRPVVKKVKVMGNQRVTQGGTIKRTKARIVSVKKKAQQ
jgi:RNA-binding protein